MAKREYTTDEIVVYWDSDRCIHSGICLSLLPSVFDLDSRPWVDVEGADAETIGATIERCPSGALRYGRLDGEAGEAPPDRTTIVPWPNGPLTIRGDIHVRTAAGETLAEGVRVSLCRCGASGNQPFCDNSHRRVEFSDSEQRLSEQRRQAESPQDVHQGRGIDEAQRDEPKG